MSSIDANLTTHQHSELGRKLVHISFGFVALALRWLPFWGAVALAVCAIIFNAFILPFVGGRAIARNGRGNDLGIILYPVMVLTAILLFRGPLLYIAGAVWAILAFGDGTASLFGRLLPSVRLRWNNQKSLAGTAAFLFFGCVAAVTTARYLQGSPTALSLTTVCVLATIVAAICESLNLGVDDNIVVPVSAGFTLWCLHQWTTLLPLIALTKSDSVWLVANLLLAVAGYAARSVNVSGAVGGVVLGSMLILFGGWQLYAVLLIFFVFGTGATKVGYRRKAAMGLAQEEGGRRGFSHAFANVGVAVILAAWFAATGASNAMLLLAAVGALATAAADTTSSEFGQLFGRRAFLPLTFTRVAVGTEGAISIEGTLAGAFFGFATAALGVLLVTMRAASPIGVGHAIIACGLAAILGSYTESVVGSLNRQHGRQIANGALNFFNTAVGATLTYALAAAMR